MLQSPRIGQGNNLGFARINFSTPSDNFDDPDDANANGPE